jgi:hypothetical protein
MGAGARIALPARMDNEKPRRRPRRRVARVLLAVAAGVSIASAAVTGCDDDRPFGNPFFNEDMPVPAPHDMSHHVVSNDFYPPPDDGGTHD